MIAAGFQVPSTGRMAVALDLYAHASLHVSRLYYLCSCRASFGCMTLLWLASPGHIACPTQIVACLSLSHVVRLYGERRTLADLTRY